VTPAGEIENLLAEERRELTEMLASNATVRFQQYLNDNSEAHKLLFWFEIEDYKAIPHTQTAFIQGRAQKVGDWGPHPTTRGWTWRGFRV
jgi:hypothetical protein